MRQLCAFISKWIHLKFSSSLAFLKYRHQGAPQAKLMKWTPLSKHILCFNNCKMHDTRRWRNILSFKPLQDMWITCATSYEGHWKLLANHIFKVLCMVNKYPIQLDRLKKKQLPGLSNIIKTGNDKRQAWQSTSPSLTFNFAQSKLFPKNFLFTGVRH